MTDGTEQIDLEGNKVPVTMETEHKDWSIWSTDNLRVKCTPESLEGFEEKVAKKQDPKERSDMKWDWIQSKAKVKTKRRLMPGVWDKETAELCAEIFGGF